MNDIDEMRNDGLYMHMLFFVLGLEIRDVVSIVKRNV